ncbi:tRNA-dihydrouridine synthase [archaeon]|jgi:tRNA-dihydrouridine synthase B|nr:tRNA-dihydrouridine synthase [archaeon]MBT4397408.1 tRNA-dihydrouridine synthase [archaeon]MBT4440480.1 tRNA-dihydrouridine synthase [archaeon]
MKIGKVKLKNELILAPMAGITNLPFRLLCKDAGLRCSEMININALERNNKSTEKLCLTHKDEKPVSFQLFGLREQPIKAAVEKIEDKADIIDFNFGCPAHQIVGAGSGAALLKRPEKVGKIISTLVKHSSIPITAKIRLGYEKNNVMKISKIIEDNGADAIAIHGRTFKQGFTGKSNWKAIAEVKEQANIPIIGNGDVTNGKQAEALLQHCDAVMIGRAAIGDPHLFTRIDHYLKTKEQLQMPSTKEKIDIFLEYTKLAKKYNLLNLHTLRQKAQEFTRNLRGSRIIRKELNKVTTTELLIKYMESLK